jgi:hypothetical protein
LFPASTALGDNRFSHAIKRLLHQPPNRKDFIHRKQSLQIQRTPEQGNPAQDRTCCLPPCPKNFRPCENFSTRPKETPSLLFLAEPTIPKKRKVKTSRRKRMEEQSLVLKRPGRFALQINLPIPQKTSKPKLLATNSLGEGAGLTQRFLPKEEAETR